MSGFKGRHHSIVTLLCECGTTFQGVKFAKYCPECRKERIKTTRKKYASSDAGKWAVKKYQISEKGCEAKLRDIAKSKNKTILNKFSPPTTGIITPCQ